MKASVFDPFMIADSTYAFNGSVQVGMYGGRDLGSALAEPLNSMGLGLVRVGAARRGASHCPMARPEGNFRRNLVRLKDAALAPSDHVLRPVEIDGPHSDHPGERHAQFVIERSIPSAGKLTPPELQAISATSCGVLRDLGPTIQWVHSYVTNDKIYCIYNAPGEALVREHARQGGFPADAVPQVRQVISPITAEGVSPPTTLRT